MNELRGTSISPGYAEGATILYSLEREVPIPRHRITPEQVASENRRFDAAVERAARELEHVRDRVLAEFGEPQAEIFVAHLALLQDPYFISKVKEHIARERVNAEQAVEAEIKTASDLLAAARDEYFHERAQDIRDVGRRVLRQLAPFDATLLGHLPPGAVVVARELHPSDTFYLDRAHVAAFVTERGGATSHAAILARAMGIPAVTAVEGAVARIPAGTLLLVDGEHGTLIANPSPEVLEAFRARRQRYEQTLERAREAEARECTTLDGVRIHLYANLGRLEEVAEVLHHHLDGVGLFRTEFMFMHESAAPELEQQRDYYAGVVKALDGRPVTLRTIDLGGDKIPEFLDDMFETDPLLGSRGLRFALTDAQDLFRTQLRAIAAACRAGKVRVMFPMVLGGGDFREAVEMLEEAVREAGVPMPEVGAMIEVPSALFTLDHILARAAFLSIGTNDLTQLLLAADRNATERGDASATVHPAVLRAIRHVAVEAEKHGKPVTVCGEAAGDPPFACLLIGLGIRHLSMSPVRASRVRYALQNVRLSDMEAMAGRALQSETSSQVRSVLAELASP